MNAPKTTIHDASTQDHMDFRQTINPRDSAYSPNCTSPTPSVCSSVAESRSGSSSAESRSGSSSAESRSGSSSAESRSGSSSAESRSGSSSAESRSGSSSAKSGSGSSSAKSGSENSYSSSNLDDSTVLCSETSSHSSSHSSHSQDNSEISINATSNSHFSNTTSDHWITGFHEDALLPFDIELLSLNSSPHQNLPHLDTGKRDTVATNIVTLNTVSPSAELNGPTSNEFDVGNTFKRKEIRHSTIHKFRRGCPSELKGFQWSSNSKTLAPLISSIKFSDKSQNETIISKANSLSNSTPSVTPQKYLEPSSVRLQTIIDSSSYNKLLIPLEVNDSPLVRVTRFKKSRSYSTELSRGIVANGVRNVKKNEIQNCAQNETDLISSPNSFLKDIVTNFVRLSPEQNDYEESKNTFYSDKCVLSIENDFGDIIDNPPDIKFHIETDSTTSEDSIIRSKSYAKEKNKTGLSDLQHQIEVKISEARMSSNLNLESMRLPFFPTAIICARLENVEVRLRQS